VSNCPDISRDPAAVDGQAYEVVVVGGGIYGALAAVHAAHRGLRTLLVEAGDFGAATSFNSLRTIHGGLRYLQWLDFARARRSNRQQLWWLEQFPDLVETRCCLMPLYGRGGHSRSAFRAAGLLARLAGMRRLAVDSHGSSALVQLLTSEEVRRRLPGIPATGLQGAALWQEGFMPESSRVIVECLRWAVAAGATVLNYAELTGAEPDRQAHVRLSLLDHASARRVSVRAAAVINAGGARVEEVARRLGAHRCPGFVPTLAWNFLLDATLPDACGLVLTPPRRGAQAYFLHPFQGRVLAGTGHAAESAQAGPAMPTPGMIERMREDFDAAYPDARFGSARILRTLAGKLPGVHGRRLRLATRPRLVPDTAAGGAAAVHLLGVKFTEAPDVARAAVDCVVGRSGTPPGPRPSPGEHWNVIDRSRPATRESLLDLAARESVVYLEDLIERRTNAWCDETAIAAVAGLVHGALVARGGRNG
jgi:glycerol-3-phosphate dehydrogenase